MDILSIFTNVISSFVVMSGSKNRAADIKSPSRLSNGPGKGWLSHDQIFQYSFKIFLQNYSPNILENLVM